jgi:bifunctional DNA-binding transcriptional regulator/antitoxin component of YhaV-PrlF toxin-antitoxin module
LPASRFGASLLPPSPDALPISCEAIMATIRMDKKGRLDLPQDMRDSHHWRAGMEFTVEDRPEGLLLRPLGDPAKTVKGQALSHGSGGCDRALATAMRDRYAKLGH